jgi:hypothetical protein
MTRKEQFVMRSTAKETLLKAADMIDKITQSDVAEMRLDCIKAGMSRENVERIDRAYVGSAHLRALAEEHAMTI